MVRLFLIFAFSLTILSPSGLSGICLFRTDSGSLNINFQDTLKENQILYNGRLWRNRYYRVKADQYLFSVEFLPGTVTMDGKSFKDLSIRYDIYNDEIMTVTNHGSILQLNKEMVDSFNIIYWNKTYSFIKMPEDSSKGFRGYMNILYKGKTALYLKYKKEIELLAVERRFDMFYQVHRIYFVKDEVVYLITGKRDFFNLLDEYKLEVRSFLKKSRIKVSKKDPESFIPVVKFYDSMTH